MRTDRFPIVARIVLDVSVASVVGGRRAPLPLTTTGGDLAVDIDTGRGATNLKFKTQVLFGSPTTPRFHFRINPSSMPAAMRAFDTSVDIAEIVPVPGYEIEAADIQVTGTSTGGRIAAQAISAYQEDLVPYMRQMVGYMLNSLLCARFGTQCPERPMPEFPTLSPPTSLIVAASAVVVLALGGAYLLIKRRKGSGLSLSAYKTTFPVNEPYGTAEELWAEFGNIADKIDESLRWMGNDCEESNSKYIDRAIRYYKEMQRLTRSSSWGLVINKHSSKYGMPVYMTPDHYRGKILRAVDAHVYGCGFDNQWPGWS
jgi:hypothetical protein